MDLNLFIFVAICVGILLNVMLCEIDHISLIQYSKNDNDDYRLSKFNWKSIIYRNWYIPYSSLFRGETFLEKFFGYKRSTKNDHDSIDYCKYLVTRKDMGWDY